MRDFRALIIYLRLIDEGINSSSWPRLEAFGEQGRLSLVFARGARTFEAGVSATGLFTRGTEECDGDKGKYSTIEHRGRQISTGSYGDEYDRDVAHFPNEDSVSSHNCDKLIGYSR